MGATENRCPPGRIFATISILPDRGGLVARLPLPSQLERRVPAEDAPGSRHEARRLARAAGDLPEAIGDAWQRARVKQRRSVICRKDSSAATVSSPATDT